MENIDMKYRYIKRKISIFLVFRYRYCITSSGLLNVESVTVVDSMKRVPARRDLIQIKSEELFTLKFVCVSFYVCTISFQIIESLLQPIVIQCQA